MSPEICIQEQVVDGVHELLHFWIDYDFMRSGGYIVEIPAGLDPAFCYSQDSGGKCNITKIITYGIGYPGATGNHS